MPVFHKNVDVGILSLAIRRSGLAQAPRTPLATNLLTRTRKERVNAGREADNS
jgi:hypothetical protein